MATKQARDEQDMIVYRRYVHYGIAIDVELNFLDHTVSIVEWDKSANKFKPKKWTFAERELEYMNGWIIIFRAMEHAINLAKIELKANSDFEFEKFAELMRNLDSFTDAELSDDKNTK